MYRRSADEEERDPGPLTTAATYLDPVQAELGRAKLESCDIRAVVVEPTGFNPLLTASAGGVLLKVAESEVGPRASDPRPGGR
jgi:hypothetical protein